MIAFISERANSVWRKTKRNPISFATQCWLSALAAGFVTLLKHFCVYNFQFQMPKHTSILSIDDMNSNLIVPATSKSVEMSQLIVHSEDRLTQSKASEFFPSTQYDTNEQQIDLRTTNSWTLKIDQIASPGNCIFSFFCKIDLKWNLMKYSILDIGFQKHIRHRVGRSLCDQYTCAIYDKQAGNSIVCEGIQIVTLSRIWYYTQNIYAIRVLSRINSL
jgi:hypothetical protein